MAAVVLVQAYTSLLITYIIDPNNPPLIKNVNDIVNNPEIKFIVEKTRGYDYIISVKKLFYISFNGIFKNVE